MNESQLRRIISQQIREEIISANKAPLLIEYGDEGSSNILYKIFLSPMVDVLKGAKLASQDILNSFQLIFMTLITLSPKKLVEARKDYQSVKRGLDAEWAPLMKKVGESIDSTDFGLVSFAMAPNLFLGYHLGKFAINAPTTVVDYFERTGLDIPFNNLIRDIDSYDYDTERGAGGGRERRSGRSSSSSQDTGILDRLRVFFLGEAASALSNSDLMLEVNVEDSKDKKNKLTSKNISAEIGKYFKETGFDKKLDKLSEDMINAKKSHADKLLAASREQVDILKSFAYANSIEEFETALKKAKTKGAEVDKIQKKIEELKADIQKKTQQLKSDKSFIEKIQKSAKDKKLSDSDISKAADTAALDASKRAIQQIKQNVKEILDRAFDEIKKQIREELSEDLPKKDSAIYADFSKTKRGKEMLSVIDNAVNSLGPSNA